MLQFINDISDHDVYLSRDMEDLSLSTDSEAKITVSFSTDSRSVSFILSPYDHSLSIRTRDILENLIPAGEITNVIVSAASDDGSAEIPFLAILGGMGSDGKTSMNRDIILSTRPQVCRLYDGLANLCSVPVLLAPKDCTDVISWVVYPRGLRPVEFIPHIERNISFQTLTVFNLPVSAIQDFPAGIRAVDFCIGAQTLRYIVMKSDARTDVFRFRNQFGMMDIIYANGGLSSDIESTQYSSVAINDEDISCAVDFIQKKSSNSGLIATMDGVRFWEDFFRSAEHYIFEDKDWKRIILDDISSGNNQKGRISSFSFSWHYAKQPSGRKVEYKKLDPYQYEIPEL